MSTPLSPPASAPANADPAELARFSALAHRWWDPGSEMKPLHDINPLRVDWIDEVAGGLAGRSVVDVGCGGGILSEALARRGAKVTGIDLSDKALGVARLHQLESAVAVDYRLVSAEAFAAEAPAAFDIVTCLEMLEHVPDPASTVAACARLVRPGGSVVFSTLNRNAKSYALAVLAAEYVLNMLPRGTHDWSRFLRPSELARFARAAGLDVATLAGITYAPLTGSYRVSADTSVNYLMACRRPAESSPSPHERKARDA
jgi:2-polyprenyl-6-hydroxyphenyl methylase/3-demethylubiquinone-9 3-methyltransferase